VRAGKTQRECEQGRGCRRETGAASRGVKGETLETESWPEWERKWSSAFAWLRAPRFLAGSLIGCAAVQAAHGGVALGAAMATGIADMDDFARVRCLNAAARTGQGLLCRCLFKGPSPGIKTRSYFYMGAQLLLGPQVMLAGIASCPSPLPLPLPRRRRRLVPTRSLGCQALAQRVFVLAAWTGCAKPPFAPAGS
jgi:hypothetical protein